MPWPLQTPTRLTWCGSHGRSWRAAGRSRGKVSGHEPAGKGLLLGHGWGKAPTRPGPAQPCKCFSLLPPPVEDLLTAACSSIFPGAGTNQELALHCLHESRGDILVRPCPPVEEGPLGRPAGSCVPGPGARPVSGTDWRRAGGSDQGGDGRGSARGSPGSGLETSLCRVHASLWVVGSPPLRQGCPLRTVSISDCSLGDQVFSLETPRVAQTQ